MAENEKSPLVSIMMPVYNGIKTLPMAINSLKNQTYNNWLCIIVNDGSNDGTKDYLDSLTDKRFKIIHFNENKGRPYARQAALEACEGEYLAYLDADDFYHPDKIKKQLDILNNNPELSLVSCGMGSFNGSFILERVRCNYNTKAIKYEMGQDYKPARAAAMIRLPDAKYIKYNLNLKYAQDTDYFVKYLDNKYYINIDDILYFYSEFNSVTKSKILKTKYFGILYHSSLFKHKPILSLTRILKNIFKIFILILIYPFVKDEKFLTGRGIEPNAEQVNEFNRVKLINDIPNAVTR